MTVIYLSRFHCVSSSGAKNETIFDANLYVLRKADPRHSVASGRLIIWRLFKPIFLKLFRHEARLANTS